MNTPKDPRHPPLQDEEADLARVLRALPAGEPPAAVDAAILKAASDALAAGGAARPRRRLPGWAFGTAAAAVLAIGIGMNLRPPTPGEEAKARAESGLAEVAPSAPADSESKAVADAADAAAFDEASADAAVAAEISLPGTDHPSPSAGAGALPSAAPPADAALELGRAAVANDAAPQEAAEPPRASADRLLRSTLPEPPAEPPPAAHQVAPAPPPPPPPAPPAPPVPMSPAPPVAEAPASPSPAVAAPAPAATADPDPQDEALRLDAIEVTGSRIKRSDIADREAAALSREQAAREREARASAAYAERRQAAAAEQQRQEAVQAFPASPAAATAPAAPKPALPPIARDAELSAEAWLLRIRERREAGDIAGARASLLAFARAHPDRRLPDDLADLLE